jgi:hypothetical protein
VRRLLLTTAVVSAIAVSTLALDGIAFAATGSSLVLGKLNTSTTTTVIQGGSAPVLSLRSSTATAVPFAVNGTGRVVNLNADRIDSLDATQLQRRVAASCASGQAMTGITAVGVPVCRSIEPTSILVDFAERGPFDESQALTTPAIAGGRYLLTLTADLIPSLRGTDSAPKGAACQVSMAGVRVVNAEALDQGISTAASVRTSEVVDLKSGPLSITCGFERGTWSFGSSPAPRLLLTPLPSVTNVTAS